MSRFNYLANPGRLAELERGLSSNRLARYTAMAGGNAAGGLELYTWNSDLSGALYWPLQTLEILTRNRVHDTLSTRYGPDWYDQPAVGLQRPQTDALADAKQKLASARKVISPPSVVAELSFGFWTGLFGRGYDTTLWRLELWKIFRSRVGRNSRKAIAGDYGDIRNLRNRIAHHECILRPDLPRTRGEIIDLIRAICPDTADWVEHHCRFPSAWMVAENPWIPPAP